MPWRLGLGLLAALLGACAQEDTVASRGADAGTGSDAAVGCASGGPPSIAVGAAATCGARLGASLFRYALCVCGAAPVAALTSDAFDSRAGSSGGGGAAVGINQGYTGGGRGQIGGSLTVGGDVDAGQPLTVAGDLRVAGGLRLSGASTVSRDAWVAGAITIAPGALTIDRDLYTPAPPLTAPKVNGQPHYLSVSVAPPCACDAMSGLDIAAAIADGRAHNDNASIGLAPDRLASFSGNATLTLGCGRYYLDSIHGSGQVRLVVSGPVALFVGGDVSVAGMAAIQVADGAELDLFIGGALAINGAAGVGDAAHPATTRLYLGGNDIMIKGNGALVGNVYAPAARVTPSAAQLTVTGALVAASIVASNVTVHYDRAIGAGGECAAPGTCRGCGDCDGGRACIAGACAACRVDADCCAPLACVAGTCAPLMP